jgi:hypothetical protein
MRTVYIYTEGSDLHEQAEHLIVGFAELAARWSGHGARLVNQLYDRTPQMKAEDLQDWSLGINIPLSQFHAQQVDELLPVLRRLAASTGRDFVVGVAEETGITEDLVFVGAGSLEKARQDLLLHVVGQ